jgi:uncharacterized protein (UPF0333 family)
LKFCAERILPMSAFDSAKNSNSTPQVTINITSLSDTKQVYNKDEGIIDV